MCGGDKNHRVKLSHRTRGRAGAGLISAVSVAFLCRPLCHVLLSAAGCRPPVCPVWGRGQSDTRTRTRTHACTHTVHEGCCHFDTVCLDQAAPPLTSSPPFIHHQLDEQFIIKTKCHNKKSNVLLVRNNRNISLDQTRLHLINQQQTQDTYLL